MTFDDAGAKADQEFDLMKDPGVQSQDRHLLFCPPSLHFPTNFGEDIGLAGKCTEANRVGKINAVYEARAVPEDQPMADK